MSRCGGMSFLSTSHRGEMLCESTTYAANSAYQAGQRRSTMHKTVSLAREVAPHGIHVNAVAAGMTATDMARDALERNAQRYLKRIPLGRIAHPAEIAQVVVFLSSDRASYMTGTTVDVSGGMLMR